jgi:hypothetical protein
MRRSPFTPRNIPGTFFVRGCVDSRATVRLEKLGKIKKSSDLKGNRTRDLPVYSIVPQQTTLPRSPDLTMLSLSGEDLCSERMNHHRVNQKEVLLVRYRGNIQRG